MMISYSDRGQAAEGVLPASAVAGPFDPGDDGDAQLLASRPGPAVEDDLTPIRSPPRVRVRLLVEPTARRTRPA